MCPHEVDKMGYPVDPELRSLQAYLGSLAAMWRHANATLDSKRKEELVNEYHQTLATLYERGWDDGLDIDSELPYDLMPQEYFDRAEKRREAETERLRKNGVLAELQRLRESGLYQQQKPPPLTEAPNPQRYVPIDPQTRHAAFRIDWRAKLRMLMAALHQGHPFLRFGFQVTEPLPIRAIERSAKQLGVPLPYALRELYTITDGLRIGLHISIGGLRSSRGGETIIQLNERLLPTVQAACRTRAIHLLIGGDNGLHGTFGVTEESMVVAIANHDPGRIRPMAPSLDAFFDRVCLGSAYTDHYVPQPLWMSVLEEFGFVQADNDPTAYGSH